MIVLAPREWQARRFVGHERVRVNAEMGPAEARTYCEVDAAPSDDAKPYQEREVRRLLEEVRKAQGQP